MAQRRERKQEREDKKNWVGPYKAERREGKDIVDVYAI